MKTKIIVIDDHPLMRQGIIATLRNEYDLDIVGEADCGKAALEMAPRLSPDIVLLDLNLPDMPGESVIQKLKKNYPFIKTIVLSNYSDSSHIQIAIKAGAFGYLVKTDPPEAVIQAIRDAMIGKKTFTNVVKNKFTFLNDIDCLQKTVQPILTQREIDILCLIARGLSNREIAERCCVSESTVRSHIFHIKEKKGVDSREMLVVIALREGLN
jgi:DNA-binding NarL/FixJ family response regulator